MDLYASDVFTEIGGFYPQGLLDPVTSYLMPNRWFSPAYRKKRWDGRIRFVKYDRKKKRYQFPTGFLSRVTEFLDQRQPGTYNLYDYRRIEPVENLCVELQDREHGTIRLDEGKFSYQADAVQACLLHGRGIVHAATSSGKSEVGAAVIQSIGKPTVWFTHLRALLYQTQARLAERLGRKIGIIGDGKCDYQDVTVAMVQTCSYREHDEFLRSREVLVADECHHISGGSVASGGGDWYDNMAACPAPYRFGLSATPELDDRGLKLLAMTGSVIFRITTDELISRGVAVPPHIWFADVPGAAIKCSNWRQAYNDGVVNNPERNRLICDIAKQLVLDGKLPLILVSRIKHGEELVESLDRIAVNAEFIHGSVEQEERDAILNRLWNGKTQAAVAIAATMGEGINLPKLRAIINAMGLQGGGDAREGDSGRSTIQILGRGLRACEGKEYVDYVDFVDRCHKFLAEASMSRLGTLREQGFSDRIKLWKDYAA